MKRPHYILLPVNTWFITLSLVIAFLLNLLPWGQRIGVPDFVALALLFWNTHQPRKVGIGIAFVLGILTDVHHASLLGEHALAYTILSFGAITLHKRVCWFPLAAQIFHVLPLLILSHLTPFMVRLIAGAPFPGWAYLSGSFVEALLWPVTTFILLAPQRRAIDPDDTRPI